MAGQHRASVSKRRGGRWGAVAVAVTGVAGALATAPAASGDPLGLALTNTIVTPEDLHGFGPADTRGGGSTGFTEEFGAPSGGNAGALGVETPESGSKAQFFTGEQNGPLADFVDSASYSTYKSSTSTGNAIQYPSYQIAIDRNGGALEPGDFSTLFYEPYYNVADPAGDLAVDRWQTWDVAGGRLCSTRAIGGISDSERNCGNGGLRTLEEYVAANEGATVLGFGINQGSGNPGIVAAVDLLEGAGTTYDFEVRKPLVVLPPVDPPTDPEPVPDPDPTPPVDPDEHPGGGWWDGEHDGEDDGDEGHDGEDEHGWSDEGKGSDDEDDHDHGGDHCTCG